MEMFNPAHAGEILREYMGDDVTVTALAKHLGMTRANLSRILNGHMRISAIVATKLSEAFPQADAGFWLRLQDQYDLAQVRKTRRTKLAPIRDVLQKAA
jgi:addiction module HigA family antidote